MARRGRTRETTPTHLLIMTTRTIAAAISDAANFELQCEQLRHRKIGGSRSAPVKL
jgi:hypothetical protein